MTFDLDYVAEEIVLSLWMHRPVSSWSKGDNFAKFETRVFPMVKDFLKEVFAE